MVTMYTYANGVLTVIDYLQKVHKCFDRSGPFANQVIHTYIYIYIPLRISFKY